MEDPANITAANRSEAERLLGISEKLLHNRDLSGSRDFAILAQETEPLLDGSDQILAIVDVLLAAEHRIHNHRDWYSILQTDRKSSDDIDIVKKQYRRLALLLHPDKNKYPLAETAFRLVADAWNVLSDSLKKSSYDNELSFFFSKVDLVPNLNNNNNNNNQHSMRNHNQFNMQNHNENRNQNHNNNQHEQVKLPVRRTAEEKNKQQKGAGLGSGSASTNRLSFWTACPYCYTLYEYPRVYDECCLRCQNCQRAFHAASIPDLPPIVPGKEAYYCCWGFFPLGFSSAEANGNGVASNAKIPTWMPPMFPQQPPPQSQGNVANMNNVVDVDVDVDVDVNKGYDGNGSVPGFVSGKKKRGRPRKYAR